MKKLLMSLAVFGSSMFLAPVALSEESSMNVFSGTCIVTWSNGDTHGLSPNITFVSENTLLACPQFIVYKPSPESGASISNLINKVGNEVCVYHYYGHAKPDGVQAIAKCTLKRK